MNVLLPYKWSQDHVALVSGPGPSMIRNSNGCFSCEEEKSWTHKLRLKGFNMGHFGWYFCVNFGMVCPHAPPPPNLLLTPLSRTFNGSRTNHTTICLWAFMWSLFLIEHLYLSGICQGLYLGHVYTKAIGPCLLRILELSLVESVMGPALSLHEGSLGLQPHDVFIG
jgi:hypothetical protein